MKSSSGGLGCPCSSARGRAPGDRPALAQGLEAHRVSLRRCSSSRRVCRRHSPTREPRPSICRRAWPAPRARWARWALVRQARLLDCPGSAPRRFHLHHGGREHREHLQPGHERSLRHSPRQCGGRRVDPAAVARPAANGNAARTVASAQAAGTAARMVPGGDALSSPPAVTTPRRTSRARSRSRPCSSRRWVVRSDRRR